MDEKVEAMQSAIDEAIAPEAMSQEEAIEFLDRIEDYCRTMAEGIRGDLGG